MILFRHSLKPPRDWCCTVFIFHDVLKRTLMFSPLNPGAPILLKNFMRSNYCFTAVSHRAFSIYIIISQASLLSCNKIRKHTLYPTDWMGSQGYVFLCEVMTRGGERGNLLFHPENRFCLWEPWWSMHRHPNRRVNTVIKVAGFVQWRLQRLFSSLFSLVIYFSQQAKLTWSSDALRMGI